MSQPQPVFAGSIPELYDTFMGPLFFAPFAAEMARRLSGMQAGALLETAAGTGIVTQRLAATLPEAVAITATDLNQPMLDHAMAKPGMARITFRQADAQALPFAEASFDALVCQFGIMFLPDRVEGYREARRVLRPGGRFLCSAWGRIADSPVAQITVSALARAFPRPGPWFLERIPHSYFDPERIGRDLRAAGWTAFRVETVTLSGHAASAHHAAFAMCQGTPMRAEIEALGPGALEKATDLAAAEIAAQFGAGAFDSPIVALVIDAVR